MLFPTTCVGLRYGPHISLFSAVDTLDCRLGRSLGVLSPARTGFNAAFRRRAPGPRLRRFCRCAGTEILIRCPSASPFGYRVRPRLTPGRLAWPGKPWSFGVGVSRPHCRYSCLHFRSGPLHRPSQVRLPRSPDAPLPLPARWRGGHGFGNMLMPDHYPCGTARPVSCYALFKRMAASKPTSWLSGQSHRV